MPEQKTPPTRLKLTVQYPRRLWHLRELLTRAEEMGFTDDAFVAASTEEIRVSRTLP